MDDILFKTLIYDYYNELLTDTQKQMYSMYYFDDCSITEIGEQFNISRQGARDSVKNAENKLCKYEEILNLVKKHEENKKKFNSLKKSVEDLIEDKKLKEEINEKFEEFIE